MGNGIQMKNKEQTQQWADEATSPARKRSIPEGLWIRCDVCSSILFRRSVENNLGVCPECQHHFRIGAQERIEQLVDPETFVQFDETLSPEDPLNFVDVKPYK